ncbi:MULTISPECIES: SDR family NAD(P)-dependent oxidoreductase [Polaromonas]|uniref:SDR family NAD(P)-dependent oxidoreductase n=1 Tax=Polaromonas aquatica TaxID=332657 RepID=A0ABW1TU85_9BURK
MSNEMQRAIVTGSSSGIGLAIAENLLAQGWTVSGFDIAPAHINHPSYSHVQLDLCDTAALDAAARAEPTAQALVHAAGVLRVAPLGQLQAADAAFMWQIHVNALSNIANIVVPRMASAGMGRVVIVGSRVARGFAGRSQYAATKAALISLARSWAAEVVAKGVTVNVVSPAATQTAMLDDPARKTAAPRLPPMGRLVQPAEIASLVSYLLSPAAAAITGQDIQICGGSSLLT